MANIPKLQKELWPIYLKLIQVSCIPLNIFKNISYPLKFFANIPVSLKTLPGPHLCYEMYDKDIIENRNLKKKKSNTPLLKKNCE